MNTYEEVEAFLFQQLPMFQRQGAVAFKKDLSNIRTLCAVLGEPQQNFKSFHIAGTNGKGSSAHSIASVLQAAGYKVGLYTSPHLKRFTERIKINGREIDQRDVVIFVQDLENSIAKIKPSFFELTVAMAFWYFSREKVDLAIVETGMGGRLDSTNILEPIACLITTIGFDHQAFLGNTLPEIAGEKAGIIKPNTPVVIGTNPPDVLPVFKKNAEDRHAALHYAPANWKVDKVEQGQYRCHSNAHQLDQLLSFGLQGEYQRWNLPGILESLLLLEELGFSNHSCWEEGLAHVSTHTGLKGRWQVLRRAPFTVCDTGHNEAALSVLMKQVAEKGSSAHLILGLTKEKQELLARDFWPKHARYYFCQADNPRCADWEVLKDIASRAGKQVGFCAADVNEVWAHVRKQAQPQEVVFIGGSTFTVAEIEEV